MADDIMAQRQQFYQNQRQNINQGANAQEQTNQDALNRRFAAIGQSGSGSAIQATLDSQRDVGAQKEKNLNDLSGQESGENLQIQEAQKGRDFQAGQAGLQRQFEGGQSELQRQFQGGLQRDLQTQSLGQQQHQFDLDMPLKQRGLDLQASQQELDRQANAVNERMGNDQGKKSGGFLGGGGILGTGIGSK